MTEERMKIASRDFKHGKIAYKFQWNKTHHERIGNKTGDSACLWAHLESVARGSISEEPFTNPFYASASGLRFKKMPTAAKVKFRRKLERNGTISVDIEHDLVKLIREFHKKEEDDSYRADHSILRNFLKYDPHSVAIEVPVWSDSYSLSGHIDLVRIFGDTIHVCDYKPGSLESTPRRFFDSIPQIAAYGEMMSHHLASTLRSALDASLLPKVLCWIFDTHSAWSFGAEMYVTLEAAGMLKEF